MPSERNSLSGIIGSWVNPDFESGLIARCRDAWQKPIDSLTNEEIATLLRQKIAVEHLLPIAKKRVKDRTDDDTEMFVGELAAAISHAEGDAWVA